MESASGTAVGSPDLPFTGVGLSILAAVAGLALALGLVLHHGGARRRRSPHWRDVGAASLLLAASWPAAAAGAATADPARLVVGFVPGTPPAVQTATVESAGANVHMLIPQLDVVVGTSATESLARVRDRLRRSAAVAYEELDPKAHATAVPNDPLVGEQYALPAIRAFDAWNTTAGAESIVVGVLDTGVDYRHRDLAGRVDLGLDVVDMDGDPVEGATGFPHGTHVAGIIAARANDSYGIAGAAPLSRVLAVRVLGADGSGHYSDIVAGIVGATDGGADIVNLSLGGTADSIVLREGVAYASARGVIPVCAAGNAGSTMLLYPAAYPECIAVGATDARDAVATFSNRGPGIDVVAPGVSILSTVRDGHGLASGTSMAAPYVSSIVALLLSAGVAPANVPGRLAATADDLGPAGYDQASGHGRVNAARAIPMAVAPQPAPPSPSPTPDAPAPAPTSPSPTSPPAPGASPAPATSAPRGIWQSTRTGAARPCGTARRPCVWQRGAIVYVAVRLRRQSSAYRTVRFQFDRIDGARATRIVSATARVRGDRLTGVRIRNSRLAGARVRLRVTEDVGRSRIAVGATGYLRISR